MTRVNALVLILDYADTPFFMMYDDLSLSQNIERINLWREVTALYFNSLIHESATKKKCNVSFLELNSNKKHLE